MLSYCKYFIKITFNDLMTKKTKEQQEQNAFNLLGFHQTRHNQCLFQECEVQSRLFHLCCTKKETTLSLSSKVLKQTFLATLAVS